MYKKGKTKRKRTRRKKPSKKNAPCISASPVPVHRSVRIVPGANACIARICRKTTKANRQKPKPLLGYRCNQGRKGAKRHGTAAPAPAAAAAAKGEGMGDHCSELLLYDGILKGHSTSRSFSWAVLSLPTSASMDSLL